MRWKLLTLLTALAVASSCASSGVSGHDADEQLEFGVRVARQGLWQEANFRFARAAELDKDNAEVLNNLAVSQEALGMFDEALANYKRALEIDPKNVSIKRNYARFAEFFTSYSRRLKSRGEGDAKN